MAGAGADPWSQAFPWLVATGTAGRLRSLLRDAETACRESAVMLRAAGRERQAVRAEQFAARARWSLDDPAGARQVHDAARVLYDRAGPATLPGRILAGALALTGTDRGQVQVIDPVSGALRTAARQGASFRAAWPVPLIDRDGLLRGVVSIHYPEHSEPVARDRLILAHYAELAAQAIAGGTEHRQVYRPFKGK
jgi:hypothetical protein